MDSSSKRNKSQNYSARKSSSKKNSISDSNDFPIRHLTKSEYMKVRNIPLLEPDMKKYADIGPSNYICQLTINPKKSVSPEKFKDYQIKETTKKKGLDYNDEYEPKPNNILEKGLQDERKINKKLVDDLTRSEQEKEDLMRKIKQLDNDHNHYQEKMQDSYEQKIHELTEELEKIKHHPKDQDDILNNNKQLRKDNEALLKEIRELKNFKENTVAENSSDKFKSILEEKDRRFKNLEILFNNEKENNELLKDRNRQLLNENQILQEKAHQNKNDKGKEDFDAFQDKIKYLINENQGLKGKNAELEAIIQEKNSPESIKSLHDREEKITMLTTEIARLQFLLKEKDMQHEREMRDKENKHKLDLREKDLKNEKDLLDLKQNIQPALKSGIEKELKEITDHFNEQKNNFENDLKFLRAKIAELEEKNLDLRTKLEKFHLATPELVKENEIWRKKFSDLEKEYRKLLQDLNELKQNEHSNFDAIKSNLDQNKKKELMIGNELMALKQALVEKDKEIIALKGKLQNQNLYCEKLMNDNNIKTQDLIALDRNYKELFNEYNALLNNQPLINEERKKEFNDKIKDLEEKITLMITENQRLTDIIKDKANENEYLAKILKDKLDEIEHLKTLLAQNQNSNSANFEALKNDLENRKNREIESAIKDISLKYLQEKAENDKELPNLKVNLNDLQRKLFEKEEEINFLKKRQEEHAKKAFSQPNSQYVEDENRFLQQEKKNLEGKIMQLLQENEKMKRKFDDILQQNSPIKGKNNSLNNSPYPKKPENESMNPLRGAIDKIAELEDKLQNSEKEKQKIINMLGEKQRENEILTSKLNLSDQLKDKELSDLKRLLDRNQEQTKKANPNKLNDLEKIVDNLQQELDHKNRALRDKADECEKLKAKPQESQSLPNDYNACFEENVKLAGAKTALEGELFKVNQKVLDLANHNQMLKNDINQLESDNQKQKKEIEDWKNKFFSVEEKQIKELEDLRKQMENYKRQNMDIREINQKFSSEKENYENQLNMMKKLIDAKEKELDKTYELLNLRKKELDNLSREYNDLKNDKLEVSLNSSRFNSNLNPHDLDSAKHVRSLAGENEELQKLVLHYKNQSEKKDREFMKKSQELEYKIQDLDSLKTRYMPENKNNTNQKIRYYTPTPTRVY